MMGIILTTSPNISTLAILRQNCPLRRSIVKFRLLVILLILIFVKTSFAAEGYGVKEEWRTCSVNEDCMAALRGCWVWEPINSNNLKAFIARNPPACLGSIDPGLQPVTVCVNKVCQATDQTTHIKWDEWLRKHSN